MPGTGPRKPEHIAKKLAKMKAQYAALTPEQKQAIRDRVRKWRSDPGVKNRIAKRARLRVMNLPPEEKKKIAARHNIRQTKRYWDMTDENRKEHNRRRYRARMANEEINWSCMGGCGLKTKHPTGFCSPCRTVLCRACEKSLEMTFIGQRVHEKCKPKGPEEYSWARQ